MGVISVPIYPDGYGVRVRSMYDVIFIGFRGLVVIVLQALLRVWTPFMLEVRFRELWASLALLRGKNRYCYQGTLVTSK